MRAVIISVKPEWVEKIVNGEKLLEVRKTAPMRITYKEPFKMYLYCTKDRHLACVVNKYGAELFYTCNNETAFIVGGYLANGKVVAEIDNPCYMQIDDVAKNNPVILKNSCLTKKQLDDYLGKKKGYGFGFNHWDVTVYDKPKELSEFGLTKAPQSWCYVEELEAK